MTEITQLFGAKPTSKPAPTSRAVTITTGQFGVRFSGNEAKLSISQEALYEIAQGSVPAPGSEAQKLFLIQYLGLSDAVCEFLEETAIREDITFAEALNFHLGMAIPD